MDTDNPTCSNTQKPEPASIPEDGIYWIRLAERYTGWQLGEWELVQIGDGIPGEYSVLGDNQTGMWNDYYSCVVIVGPKVEKPE